jgi:hypothetical protein
VSLKGVFNVYRRPNRSYEGYHRDKRRKNVDRLAILESRHAGPPPPSAMRRFLGAIGRLMRRRGEASLSSRMPPPTTTPTPTPTPTPIDPEA